MTGEMLLECGGTAWEIGEQYGKARAARFSRALEDFYALLRLFPQQATREVAVAAARRLAEPAQAVDPEGVSFIEGQAAGAGLAFEDVFAMHCLLELLFNAGNLSGMCSSFALTGPATRGGRTIVGQTVDWMTCSPVDLLRVSRADGSKALILCLFGAPYYHLTSHGLCNCANLTFGPMDNAAHVPLGVYLPRAMRRADFATALDILHASARGLGYFHLADAAGNMAGLESVPGRVEIISPVEGVLVHANHYEHPAFAPLDVGLAYMPDSPLRAARLREFIAVRHGRITEKDMMDALADHSNGPYSICRHPDPAVPPELASETRAAFVALPGEGIMWVAFGQPCQAEFREYRV